VDVTFPRESAEYRAARERAAQQGESSSGDQNGGGPAEARRELPPGGEVPEDYVFQG